MDGVIPNSPFAAVAQVDVVQLRSISPTPSEENENGESNNTSTAAKLPGMLDVCPVGADDDNVSYVSQSENPSSFEAKGSLGSQSQVVSERLENVKRQGRLRLLRLRVPTISLSIACILVGLSLMMVAVEYSALAIIAQMLLTWASIFFSLSILPTVADQRLMRRSMKFVMIPAMGGLALSTLPAVIFFFLAGGSASEPCKLAGQKVPCWNLTIMGYCGVYDLTTEFCACLWYIVQLRRTQLIPEVLLRQHYNILGIVLLNFSVSETLALIGPATSDMPEVTLWMAICSVSLLTSSAICLLGSKPIANVQSWLMSRGEGAAAAAGVAELLGGQSADEVLKAARGNFLCVTADKVSRQDMAKNTPNPELGKLTQQSRLGQVDAFVSHSWHDDADTKWAALQQWREKFQKESGREPKLWIDKYCVDQRNITECLTCLPVFLMGCRKLVIFCGETYLDRLWCLIEIAVFLEMGGTEHNLEVHILDESFDPKGSFEARRGSAVITMAQRLATFDPRNAHAFTEYDTERLQRVIESTGYHLITQLVSEVFTRRVVQTD